MGRIPVWFVAVVLGAVALCSAPVRAAEPTEPPPEAEMLRDLDVLINLLEDVGLTNVRDFLGRFRILEGFRLLERLGLMESPAPVAPAPTEEK
jgi:hypothetical protein